jgi:hypothetical protein
MKKFIDGIHENDISNDNLNEKNMLPNFFLSYTTFDKNSILGKLNVIIYLT